MEGALSRLSPKQMANAMKDSSLACSMQQAEPIVLRDEASNYHKPCTAKTRMIVKKVLWQLIISLSALSGAYFAAPLISYPILYYPILG